MLIPCDASTYDDGGHRAQPPLREVDGVDCLDAHELIDREIPAIPAIHTTTRGKRRNGSQQLVLGAGAQTRAPRAETGGERKL